MIDPPAAASELEPLAAGAQLGRFIILDRLGEGAMGVVYVGYDVQLDRKVALKVIREEIVSERVRRRTIREAQALAKLSHPNVVHVYETGEHHRRLFVAMEYIEGQNLRQWMRERERSWTEILATVCAAGRGLAAAHALGLVHRDVKPDNILVGRDGRARLADFGLVRSYTNQKGEPPDSDEPPGSERSGSGALGGEVPLTEVSQMVGTPAYMPPEQFRGKEVGPHSDQFSLCATLYEVLYGVRPFAGKTIGEILRHVAEGALTPPPVSRVPRWVLRVLQRGLELEPAARWPSVDALLDALARDPIQRRKRVAGGLVAAVLVAGGAGMTASTLDVAAPRCQGAAEQLDGIWGDAQRSALLRAFTARGGAAAQETFVRVTRILDDYTEAWVQLHTDVCEGHQRGETSAELLDRSMTCLARRRSELAALVGVLGETTGDTLDNTVQAAASLPRLAPCQNPETLLVAAPPPHDPALAAEVEALHQELDRALALESAGRHTESLRLLETMEPRVTRAAHPPLAAEWLLRRGSAQMWNDDFVPAAESLMLALVAGQEARTDAIAVEALIKWSFTVGCGLGRSKEAMAWHPFTLAWTRRLPDHPELAALMTHTASTVLAEDGQLRESVRFGREALAAWTQLYGESHPQVGFAWNNLGNFLLRLGRCEESRAALDAAERVLVKSLGDGHRLVNLVRLNQCRGLGCVGELARARACVRGLNSRATSRAELVRNHELLGGLALDESALDEAEAEYRRALELVPAGTSDASATGALIGLGRIALARNELDRADDLFRRSAAHPGRQRVFAEVGRAEVRLARGEVALAISELTAILDSEAGLYEEQLWLLAPVRFALARALAADGDPTSRAAALAQQAIEHLALGGRPFDGERERITSWLAQLTEAPGSPPASQALRR